MKRVDVKYVFFSLLIALLLGCSSSPDLVCGYNGKTIKVLKVRKAIVRDVGGEFFLYFDKAITLEAENLLDSINMLLPCNLEKKFRIDGMEVNVSGDVKENPGYSSHNNYTDFFINKININ